MKMDKLFGLLTQEQYMSLTIEGKRQEEYWREYLPKMYRSMAEKGTLYPTLVERGRRMMEEMDELIQKGGLYEHEAREFINQEMYDLPPEEPE